MTKKTTSSKPTPKKVVRKTTVKNKATSQVVIDSSKPLLEHDQQVFFIDKRMNKVIEGKIISSHTSSYPLKDEKNRVVDKVIVHSHQIKTYNDVVERREDELFTSFTKIAQLYTQLFTEYLR